jgi:hypothetical protein
LIPCYGCKWFRAENEAVTLAETSVGTGITWSMSIGGEMKLVEEIIHRIDMIYSAAPYHILNQWFLNKTLINENFSRSIRDFYEIVEASYRIHLQLPTVFSRDLNKMDEDFFRKLAKTEDTFQELVVYNKTRHVETSKKLLSIYERISKGYEGPSNPEIFELGGSLVSYQDMLQHTILSNFVNSVLNSNEPKKALNHFVMLRKELRYESLYQLNQLLSTELRNAKYTAVEGDELHSRILGGYHLVAQAVLTKNIDIVIEIMHEVLGWLTGCAFYNVFRIDENKNFAKFMNLHEILFSKKPSFSKCFLGEMIFELSEALPQNLNLPGDHHDFSECGSTIGDALMKMLLKIENAAYNMQSECLACNDTFKEMQRVGKHKQPLLKNKRILQESVDNYGRWIFNEIFKKSDNLSKKLIDLHVIDQLL